PIAVLESCRLSDRLGRAGCILAATPAGTFFRRTAEDTRQPKPPQEEDPMRSDRFRRKEIAAAVGAAALSLAAGQAFGSAFALQEQSGSGLGNAFAGGAAAAEDASTIFWNPAGMSRFSGIQTAVAGSLICPSAKFSDSGSQAAALQPLGGTGGDAGSCAVVPAAYLAVPINRQWSVGIGV